MAELDTKFELLMKDLNTLVADQNKLLKRFEKNDEKTNKIFYCAVGCRWKMRAFGGFGDDETGDVGC